MPEEDGGQSSGSDDAESGSDDESGSNGEAEEGSDDASDPFGGGSAEQSAQSSTEISSESAVQSTKSRSTSDVITDSDETRSAEASLSSNGSTEDEEDGPHTGLIIGVVAAVVVILALIVGFCWMRRRRRGRTEKEHRTKDVPADLSYRGSSSVVSDQDKGGGELYRYGDYSHEASQTHQHHAEGSSSEYRGEQPMAYAPAASQAATFAPSVADQPPPRPPPNAAQDQPVVKRGTGGWFKDRSTPSPPQGQLCVHPYFTKRPFLTD